MPTTDTVETDKTNNADTTEPGKTNKTAEGKAIAARNATTHGLFARDVVLPHLGEDPAGYQTLADELIKQLAPQNLVEHHYVEKIAAASWRLRRLQRWQAQLYEDDTLDEGERLDRLDKTLRHETALHRQIDTAVKLLAKDVPQLYARRVRARVLEDAMLSERECQECPEDDAAISMEVRNRLGRIRKATDLALPRLVAAPLDNAPTENCDNTENCQNELGASQPVPASALLLSPNWRPGSDPYTSVYDPFPLGEEARDKREGAGSAPSYSGSPELGRGGLCSDNAHENCQNEPCASDPDAIVEVDPRTHAAFLGMNEVRRVHPHAALLRREEHRVIHAAARAQSYRSTRDAGESYF